MESSYVIITDSTIDMPSEFVLENKIEVINMNFVMNGKEYTNYLDYKDISFTDFYDLMRQGSTATTSQISIQMTFNAYEKYLKQGKDILGIVFSSGLSGSFNSVRLAVRDLMEKYPERKIKIIDSRAASSGEGLLVWYANEYKKQNFSLEENFEKTMSLVPRLCHWFTVDDIDTLKRGGRVNGAAAFAAKTLKIKPVLHVDDDGHLIPKYKKIGRKAALRAVIESYNKLADPYQNETIIISHADSLEDAEFVKNEILEMVDVNIIISRIGPVIGAHAGPGTIALFFVGSHR